MKVWPGVLLVWDVAPVRANVFFGFGGCFRVRGDLGQGGGLVYQGWW